MKNYRDRQIYIGREEIDYVAYKCLEDEFQIIPVKNPEEYQEKAKENLLQKPSK